jgi:hypothetical protein
MNQWHTTNDENIPICYSPFAIRLFSAEVIYDRHRQH